MESWSNPNCLFTWKADFAIRLMRSHRIHESLLLVLSDWIPKNIHTNWQKDVKAITFVVAIHAFHEFILTIFDL